jgi:hypothetical protein
MKKRLRLRGAKGQSLVEMALTLPILLLMFAGLVEIGAALRSYLVLVNANREGVRFAARGRFFDTEQGRASIFDRVVAAAGIEQTSDGFVQALRPLPIGDAKPNTTIAIHYLVIPDQIDELGGLADEPAIINGPWYSPTVPLYANHTTQVDAVALAEAKRQENKEFNQKYFVQEGTKILDQPSADDLVIVETWYEHEQLLKLPILTAVLPEKFTLYAQSTMRVTLSRELGQ